MDIHKFRECVKDNIPNILNRAKNKEIWIYGAGRGGSIVFDILSNSKICVKGFIDQNKSNKPYKFGLPVQTIDEINKKNVFIIIAVLDYYLGTQLLDIALNKVEDERSCFFINYQIIPNTLDVEYKGIDIGRYTWVYKDFLTMVNSIEVNSIGRFCSINPTARVCANHMYENVSTYTMWRTPFIDADRCTKLHAKWHNSPKVNIGNDVWIGANVAILPHIQIGDGAIIGANAVVTKDVKPYEVVGGVPAKHIRYRFSQDIIKALLRIQWWNWDDETLKARKDFFYDVETFVRLYDLV